MKYYYPEYIHGYSKADDSGKTVFDEMYGKQTVENFSARNFLIAVLPTLSFTMKSPRVLNYGCGTGLDACFLAERGFNVDAFDIIPDAIEIARKQAKSRGLIIHFEIMDICQLPEQGEQYNMIVDSYCLQGIVFDVERKRLFSTIYNRLKPGGYYLVSSAVMDDVHRSWLRFDETATDNQYGIKYTRYGQDGGYLINLDSGIVFIPIDHPLLHKGFTGEISDYPEAKQINGIWYLPYRRHITQTQLTKELEAAGFTVIFEYPDEEGEVACVKQK